MSLPSGTVTLLFSDVEGSTQLLSRLGGSYADALDGQRRVLRSGWSAHGGTELGTEGDSFLVVFATAPDAVAAAVEVQRELDTYQWPAGERVRVRMGIHTGNPQLHDGGYVGIDVHRAARIAGAANGGQVVISASTRELIGGGLPVGVGIRDLGLHRLKDIAHPEHLFQLDIDGLDTRFGPLKTLGAASTLPTPPTPLVGRDGELAELAAVFATAGVRLVTLTGPGGSGKTRLAVGVAQGLVDAFPDGVFFVPLAAVTTRDVMWTSIAEALDLPPKGRIPPGFFTHVAHRSALLVLDNLEQISDADGVVSELLSEAPQVVVIATSRRPLHVLGEQQHAVPPLEVPEVADLEGVQRFGAVQLFLQHARAVKATFALTPANTSDVVAICRRLEGLPLAIELAAARSKLLSPHALLTRLDGALELRDGGVDRPSRHQTLRDTIAWSYDLLPPPLQEFFSRLGVFAGGADLDAITAVAADPDARSDRSDPLDLVAELVDASLLTVAETSDGDPRFQMLETVRSYAIERLNPKTEAEIVSERHARHYLGVAGQLRRGLSGQQSVETRARFELDHDNYREALAWAFSTNKEPLSRSPDRTQIGVRLCRALGTFWGMSGYWAEARQWHEQAITSAGDGAASLDLAACLDLLAECLRKLGERGRARDIAAASVDMHRRLAESTRLPFALHTLASLEAQSGHTAVARSLFEEAVAAARSSGEPWQLMSVLGDFAIFEASEQNPVRSLELDTEALAFALEAGNISGQLRAQQNMACTLRELGRIDEAHRQMHAVIPTILELRSPADLTALAEDYAAILVDLGDHARAVLLFGAADAMRERLAMPREPWQDAEIAEPIAKCRTSLTPTEWDGAYQTGRNTTVENALSDAHEVGTRE